jgi:hypothetical protein
VCGAKAKPAQTFNDDQLELVTMFVEDAKISALLHIADVFSTAAKTAKETAMQIARAN